MRIVIILALALGITLTLASCDGDKPSTADDGRGDVITENDGRGDVIDDPGESGTPEWEGAFVGLNHNQNYVIKITEFSGSSFLFDISSDELVIFSGRAVLFKDNDYAAKYNEETALSFKLSVDGNTITLTAEDDRLAGKYGIANPDNRFDLGGRGDVFSDEEGRGDIISDEEGRGDVIENDSPNWTGKFVGDENTIIITNFNDKTFNYQIYLSSNGSIFAEGLAKLYKDNVLMAEDGQISLSLYEDYNSVDFFAPESHENANMRGHYTREQ